MKVRTFCGAVHCAVLLSTASAIADSNTNTNLFSLSYESKPYIFEDNRFSDSFWARFDQFWAITATRSAMDRAGYPGMFNEVRLEQRYKYSFHEYWGRNGRGLFQDSASDAAREALVSGLALDEMEFTGRQMGRHAWGVFKSAFTGSAGASAAKRTEAVSATTAYGDIEQADIAPDVTVGVYDYGYEIFRTSPYAFVDFALGRINGRRVVFDLRGYSLIGFKDIGMIRLQGHFIVPVGRNTQLVSGVTVYPTEMNSRERSPSASCRLERIIRKGDGDPLGFASIGAQGGPHETIFAGQVSIPF